MERLQKLISACGLASRRTAEEWIAAGRVTVNGQKAHLGDQADLDRDQILVDGRPLRPGGGRTYLMLNKPRGYVTTLSDEKGRKTVATLMRPGSKSKSQRASITSRPLFMRLAESTLILRPMDHFG